VREAAGGAEVLAHLDAAPADALIADFSSGAPSATSVADLASLSQSLNYVDQQRAVIDNSINRLTASSNYASSESVQLQSAQDDLLQTDTAQVATQLSTAETRSRARFRRDIALPGAKRGTLLRRGGVVPPPSLACEGNLDSRFEDWTLPQMAKARPVWPGFSCPYLLLCGFWRNSRPRKTQLVAGTAAAHARTAA
jgi:hypothetical protein